MFMRPDFNVVMVIPTGIGASQGGYAGDASVWMNAIASICNTLITHPNVANAATFQSLPENALYVEGYALDQFLQGSWALRAVHQRRVGIVMDAGISEEMKRLHLNVINAAQVVYGLNIVGLQETEEPLNITLSINNSGVSSGAWMNPQVAIDQAKSLQHTHRADAIALLSHFEDVDVDDYTLGNGGVDPIGGLEAILSHTLVKALHIPVANAPCFDWQDAQPERNKVVSPLVASEVITPTFLPCVLQGLNKAPSYIDRSKARKADLSVHDVSAIVLPFDAMGGIPFLSAIEQNIPVIAVRSNTSVLNVDAKTLVGDAQLNHLKRLDLYFEVHNYDEALGLLQRLKCGLTAPNAKGIAWF